jgi:ATP-dependent Clp protease ATP-binding subunit ClpX
VAKKDILKHISPADLKKFGLIPEIIGRLPVLAALNPLDKPALKNILTEPKNALIKQYKKLFELEGVELQFDEAAIDFIVDKAFEFQLGARGLRGICEAILLDFMFHIPSSKKSKQLNITIDLANENWEKHKTIFNAA